MKRLLQEAFLNSEIDFNGHNLLNADEMLPVPVNLVAIDDVQLGDQRTPVAGSVTNEKVSPTAAISQSKLSLNSDIPPTWLGNKADQAAPGDLVQYSAQKNVAGGYAGLDANSRVAVGQLPSTGPNAGTVNDVKLSLPEGLDVTVPEVITAGSLTAVWHPANNNTWFGVSGQVGFGPAGMPVSQSKVIPDSLMPDLSASKFITGEFSLDRLPVMKALGVGHAAGIVPDPGMTGDPTDYLARDGSYKSVTQKVNYQPDLPEVQITLQYFQDDVASILLYCPVKGTTIFYHIQDIGASPILTPYVEAKTNPVVLSVDPNFTVYAYAAKAGYNHSAVNNFTVPPSPTA